MVNINSDMLPQFYSRRLQSVLPETDYRQLLHHLDLCEQKRGPGWKFLAYVLHNKIVNTKSVAILPDCNIVTSDCKVTYQVNRGTPETGLLTHRTRLDSRMPIIPISSLLGATLIGMRIGQRAPLINEEGSIHSLLVIDVAKEE